MDRPFFSSEHEIFRDSVRAFIEAEMVPYHADWEKQQRVPRDVWRKAGEAGLLCCDVPEAYGGFGADWLYNVVVIEEMAKAGRSEEHTSALQSLMRNSYAHLCLKK